MSREKSSVINHVDALSWEKIFEKPLLDKWICEHHETMLLTFLVRYWDEINVDKSIFTQRHLDACDKIDTSFDTLITFFSFAVSRYENPVKFSWSSRRTVNRGFFVKIFHTKSETFYHHSRFFFFEYMIASPTRSPPWATMFPSRIIFWFAREHLANLSLRNTAKNRLRYISLESRGWDFWERFEKIFLETQKGTHKQYPEEHA
jgi:hypothetical protein